MKTLRKILLFALASAMILSAAACGTSDKDAEATVSQSISEETQTADIAGEYIETVAGRATITLTKSDNGYDVWVRWPGSATEVYNWNFSGTFDDSGVMNYTGCEKTIITFDEDGNDTEKKEYTDGTGKLTLKDHVLT